MFSPAVWNRGADQGPFVGGQVGVDQDAEGVPDQVAVVSIAPLGRPVVPEVYMMTQVSSAPTGASIGSSDASAIARSYAAPTST